jgi:hypothetical protein
MLLLMMLGPVVAAIASGIFVFLGLKSLFSGNIGPGLGFIVAALLL